MVVRRVRHFGLLSNVDSTILRLSPFFGHDVRRVEYDELMRIFTQVEGLPEMRAFQHMQFDLRCYNSMDRCGYAIEDSFDVECDALKPGEPIAFLPQLTQHDTEAQQKLIPGLQVLRLMANGNVSLHYQNYLIETGGSFQRVMGRSTTMKVGAFPFSLEGVDIQQVAEALDKLHLPFANEYLNLALEDFDLAYQAERPALAFLILMVALEALFNQGTSEVTYSIARCTAVMNGKTRAEALGIFKDVRELYKKRSSIVHRGLLRQLDSAKLERLRTLVRRSILEAGLLDLRRGELFDRLNSKGFPTNIDSSKALAL